jgi:hypothetical protein
MGLIPLGIMTMLNKQLNDCDFGGLSSGRRGANRLSTRSVVCSRMKWERGGHYPNPVEFDPASPLQRAYQGRMDPSQN